MIIINGAWEIKSFPGLYAAELENGDLRIFRAMPIRALTDKDLRIVWDGKHPRESNGNSLPKRLYKPYGFILSKQAEDKENKKIIPLERPKRER